MTIELLPEATRHAAFFYIMLGSVLMFAFIVCIGQFWVLWQNRYEPKAVRRVRNLKPLSNEWPARPHRRVS